MGLGHGGMTWGMCRNGCPLRASESGDVTLDGDIFNRGTGVMTDGGEVEGNDNDDNDNGGEADADDNDEGDLVDEAGGECGEKRNNDEEGDDDNDEEEEQEEDEDGEERDLLVERSTGSVWIWNRSDGNRLSGE